MTSGGLHVAMHHTCQVSNYYYYYNYTVFYCYAILAWSNRINFIRADMCQDGIVTDFDVITQLLHTEL